MIDVVCPDCRCTIVQSGTDSFCCRGCGKEYPVIKGILSFIAPDSKVSFGDYEEKQISAWTHSAALRKKMRRNRFLEALNTARIHLSLSGRRDRFFLSQIPKDRSRIMLDLGCGGGRYYFADRAIVVGADPVFELLMEAGELYDEVYHCNALSLPFADNTFDYVVSSDFIGHISFEDKDQLFAEMFRVLKKGGRSIHLSEAMASNCWFRFARKYPDLFQKYFIDRPGHIGMEPASDLRTRFLKHGFKEVAFQQTTSTLQECGFYTSCFDNEYKHHSTALRGLVNLDRVLSKFVIVKEAINVVFEPLSRIDNAFSPIDYGSAILAAFEK